MTFSFNTGIPAANNDPSVDQPDMLTNNVSTDGIIAVDHIGFNASNGGSHKFIQFFNSPNYIVAPLPATPNGANIATTAGVANSAAALKFRNANATFPVNFIKAWAFCTPGGYDPSQQFNAGTIVRNSAGNYSVTLPANIVFGTIFSIILGFTRNASPLSSSVTTGNYNITGAGTFDLFFAINNGTPVDPFSFSFIVLQL